MSRQVMLLALILLAGAALGCWLAWGQSEDDGGVMPEASADTEEEEERASLFLPLRDESQSVC